MGSLLRLLLLSSLLLLTHLSRIDAIDDIEEWEVETTYYDDDDLGGFSSDKTFESQVSEDEVPTFQRRVSFYRHNGRESENILAKMKVRAFFFFFFFSHRKYPTKKFSIAVPTKTRVIPHVFACVPACV